VARVRKFVEDELCGLYDTCGWRKEIIKEFSLGKLEGKRKVGRPRHGWENTFEMDRKEIRCDGAGWIHLCHMGVSGSLLSK
jgi:hypothetical protein